MFWYYYVNPNREGKGPWMWACKIDGNNMYRMNSLADNGEVSDLNVVVLTSPITDPNPMSKVNEKTDKGYVYAFRLENLTDEQAVAVGTFLTRAVRNIYRGVNVSSDDLWDAIEAHSKDPVINDIWTEIPLGILPIVFDQTKEFCDRHIEKIASALKKGVFTISTFISSIKAVPIEEIVRSFQFKEGTPSPIW